MLGNPSRFSFLENENLVSFRNRVIYHNADVIKHVVDSPSFVGLEEGEHSIHMIGGMDHEPPFLESGNDFLVWVEVASVFSS